MDFEPVLNNLQSITEWNVWASIYFWIKVVAGAYSGLCIFGIFVVMIKSQALQKVAAEAKEVVHDVGYKDLPKTVFEKRWEQIKQLLESKNVSDYRAAIIDADNMLDETLQGMGYKGGNLGDRLKRLDRTKLSNLEDLWQARKLRNAFVHDPNYEPKRMEVNNAIDVYEKSLKELGALGL